MDREKLPMLAGGITIALVALSGLAVTYPALTTMGVLEKEAQKLQAEIVQIEERTHSTQDLAADLAASQARFDEEYKSVPDTPDVAGLIRKLGTFAEGAEEAYRQTLTTGQVQREEHIKSLPVILEAKGSFPDAYRLIRRVEDLDRLARLRRVTITRDTSLPEVIRATIQLDAFFDRTDLSVADAPEP